MAKKKATKRNQADLTKRNNDARKKEIAKLKQENRVLRERISHLEDVKKDVG